MACISRRFFPAVRQSPSTQYAGLGFRQLCSTSSEQLVTVERREDKIAVVRMQRKPVNALNYPMLSQLKTTFEELEDDRSVKAMVLTSDVPNIFSAGLDILEMYQATDESARRFWTSLQDAWVALYNSGLPTIAAINGNSPAGGCLLACACDYRIMANSDKYSIGLNETKLGIVAPFWFVDSFVSVIGQRKAERALQLGTLFKSADAHQIGLVDEIVPAEQVLERAVAEATEYMKINGTARRLTKQRVREAIVKRFDDERQDDVDLFAGFVMMDNVQAGLGKYIEALKAKTKK